MQNGCKSLSVPGVAERALVTEREQGKAEQTQGSEARSEFACTILRRGDNEVQMIKIGEFYTHLWVLARCLDFKT